MMKTRCGGKTGRRGDRPHPRRRRGRGGGEARSGCLLVSVSGQPLREVPAVKLAKEKVVDTTAAGDSFSAGYLAVRLTGGDAESAARRGHLTASTVIQYRGAIIPGKQCRNNPHL